MYLQKVISKKIRKKLILVDILKATDKKSRIRISVVRIRIEKSRIHNTLAAIHKGTSRMAPMDPCIVLFLHEASHSKFLWFLWFYRWVETTQLIIFCIIKNSGYLFYEMIQLNFLLQIMMWLQPFTRQPHRLFQPHGLIPRPPQPSTAVGSPFRPQPFPWIRWGSENYRTAGTALRSATFWTSPLAPLRPCSALFRWRSAGKIMSDLCTAPTRPSMNVSTEKNVVLQYYKT